MRKNKEIIFQPKFFFSMLLHVWAISLVATILSFAFSPIQAYAAVCTGIPHTSANAAFDVTLFDGDTGTCATFDSGAANPTNGFRLITDDDDISISTTFFGAFDDFAMCAPAVMPVLGTSFTNSTAACDSGSSRVVFSINGTYDVQFTLTESAAQGGNVYVLNANVTVDIGTGHTINSLSITGGVFTPNTAPVISSNGGGAIATINVAENDTAVTDVQSNDDSDTEGTGLIYSKTGGADQTLFNLDANTGVLTFAAAPDFELPSDAGANNVYDVQITVTDSGALTDVQDIAVTITDIVEDTTGPIVAIENAPATHDGSTAFNVTFEFSEDVTGFALADIAISNGAASNFVSVDDNTYRADITPNGDDDITIDVAANVATDGAANGNAAATQVSVASHLPDTTSPTVEILNAPARVSGPSQFVATFEFSEDVVNFSISDIDVTNGTVSGFTVIDGNTYLATINISGNGTATIDVASNVAQDAAGNGNIAAEQVAITNTIVADTQKVIATFMLNRANHLLANQPDIGGLLDGSNFAGGGELGNLNFTANPGGLRLAFSSSLNRIRNKADQRITQAFTAAVNRQKPQTEQQIPIRNSASYANDEIQYGEVKALSAVDQNTSRPYYTAPRNFDVWTQIYGSNARFGDSESSLWVGYFGAHYFISPDFLVGALVQVDWADETSNILANVTSRTEGAGWMVGPYLAGRLRNGPFGQVLNYEARIAWGRSHNTVSPLGTYSDNFETSRLLASAKIGGSYQLGDISMKPEARISWFEETQENFTDSLANLIPEQTISLGEIRFGPSFTRTIKMDNGVVIKPNVGISGVWNFGIKNNAASQNVAFADDDLRARLDGGLEIANSMGWLFSLTGYYDGIGLNDHEAYGASAKLTIPLR